MGGIDSVIPVHAYIPGCPASPKAIIDGVVKLLTALESGQAAPVERPRIEFDNVRELEEALIAPEQLLRVSQKNEEPTSDVQ